MSCLLRSELKTLLEGKASAALRGHLQEPCEECLALLSEADPLADASENADAMFKAAWSRRALDEAERNDMFAAAWDRRPRAPSPLRGERVGVRGRRRVIQATFALAASLALFALLYDPKPAYDGLKGSEAPTPTLILFVGSEDGSIRPGDAAGPGEMTLVRYRVDAPAVVTLVAEWKGEREVLIDGEAVTAGERELTRGEVALGLYIPGGTLTLTACAKPGVGCKTDKREIHAP